MEVYVVYYMHVGISEIHGVFSTLELAEAYVEKHRLRATLLIGEYTLDALVAQYL